MIKDILKKFINNVDERLNSGILSYTDLYEHIKAVNDSDTADAYCSAIFFSCNRFVTEDAVNRFTNDFYKKDPEEILALVHKYDLCASIPILSDYLNAYLEGTLDDTLKEILLETDVVYAFEFTLKQIVHDELSKYLKKYLSDDFFDSLNAFDISAEVDFEGGPKLLLNCDDEKVQKALDEIYFIDIEDIDSILMDALPTQLEDIMDVIDISNFKQWFIPNLSLFLT